MTLHQAVVLVGGKGTRLKSVAGNTPKPLVKIAGKTVIDHQIEVLRQYNIKHFLFLAGYGVDEFRTHFAAPQYRDLDLKLVEEAKPLGTGGALLSARHLLHDSFIVCYGDTIFDIDLHRFMRFHNDKNADFTLFLHPNDHPFDSDIVEIDANNKVVALHGYPHPPEAFLPNLVNAAFYAINKNILNDLSLQKCDIAKDLIPALIRSDKAVYGYKSREYIKDMGTPERFKKVESDLQSGQVSARSLKHKQPAIFFDRDGTLSRSLDYVTTPAQLTLLPDAGAAIKQANHAAYLTVCATNQPVIARGDCSFNTLQNIHNKLETLLGEERAYLDAIYFCPHHPDKGFAGERAEFKIQCQCRKPNDGLIQNAVDDLNIDLAASWFIGDSTTDIETARRSHIKSVLIQTGYAGLDGQFPCSPDFECEALKEASQFIVAGFEKELDSLGSQLPVEELQQKKFIFIGGPARSGKSTLASCLHFYFGRQNIASVRIALDGWFLPLNERQDGFHGRVNWNALNSFIQSIKTLSRPTEFEIPVYDRKTRAPHSQTLKINVPPNAIVILEGVAASFVEENSPDAYHILVEAPLAVRQQRFINMYLKRGLTASRAQQLFTERENEEVQLIGTKHFDFIYKFGISIKPNEEYAELCKN